MTDNDSIDFGSLHQLTGYWLRRAQLNAFKSVNDFFAEYEITPGLFGTLEVVDRNPGLTQTAVATAMGNDRSAMVAIVDRLERRGLIERRPSATDRRSNALFLTPEGRAFQSHVRQQALEHNKAFFSFLTSEEHRIFCDVLKRIAVSGG